jgi:hypothetical protein
VYSRYENGNCKQNFVEAKYYVYIKICAIVVGSEMRCGSYWVSGGLLQ